MSAGCNPPDILLFNDPSFWGRAADGGVGPHAGRPKFYTSVCCQVKGLSAARPIIGWINRME